MLSRLAVYWLPPGLASAHRVGKMITLERMLSAIHSETTEKVVVVSNWTATLDLMQNLFKLKRWNYLRLDGSTPQKQRQELVNQFNREDKKQSFVFLLSAKAGGVGLNLIGYDIRFGYGHLLTCSASRLILFDSDW